MSCSGFVVPIILGSTLLQPSFPVWHSLSHLTDMRSMSSEVDGPITVPSVHFRTSTGSGPRSSFAQTVCPGFQPPGKGGQIFAIMLGATLLQPSFPVWHSLSHLTDMRSMSSEVD